MTRSTIESRSRSQADRSPSTTMRRMSRWSTPAPALHALEAEAWTGLGSRRASVRDVMEALDKAASKPREYTTYMTILGRLHRKGLLTRPREGKTDLYT